MSKSSFSLHNNNRPSPWDAIDPSTIEIVDLTGTSPRRPTRRRPTPSTSERPSKRSKGRDPDVYISLDDDEEEEEEEMSSSSSITNSRNKSPSQSGSLSQAKCVICLDSPTDLAATPCGTSPHRLAQTDFRTFILRFLYTECFESRSSWTGEGWWSCFVFWIMSDLSKKNYY